MKKLFLLLGITALSISTAFADGYEEDEAEPQIEQETNTLPPVNPRPVFKCPRETVLRYNKNGEPYCQSMDMPPVCPADTELRHNRYGEPYCQPIELPPVCPRGTALRYDAWGNAYCQPKFRPHPPHPPHPHYPRPPFPHHHHY